MCWSLQLILRLILAYLIGDGFLASTYISMNLVVFSLSRNVYVFSPRVRELVMEKEVDN